MATVLLTTTARRIAFALLPELRKEFRQQGHSLTGKSERSYETKIRDISSGLCIEFWREGYVKFVNRGVRAANIRTPISVLIKYVEKRMGKRGKEAVRIAWAIKMKQKKEGMPTKGSYRFSKNGRRKGYEDTVLKEQYNNIAEIAGKEVSTVIEQSVFDMVDQYNDLLSKN